MTIYEDTKLRQMEGVHRRPVYLLKMHLSSLLVGRRDDHINLTRVKLAPCNFIIAFNEFTFDQTICLSMLQLGD